MAENLSLRLGVRLPACTRIDQVADAAALAERLGFYRIWFPDSQLIWRDVWMALALAAARTHRIKLGTAVTNVVTRHPSVIASATRTLQELAPGRFALGLGTGWSSAGMIGLPMTPHGEFVEAVARIETLLRGGEADFNGKRARLTAAPGSCDIFIGTQGPRNLRHAGARAKGVIITMALAPGLLEQKLSHVRAGAKAAGRRMKDLDVVVWVPAYITESPMRDIRLFKPAVYIALRNQPVDELAAAGIRTRLGGTVPPGIEPDGTHVADWDTAIDACDPLVSDALAHRWIDTFAVVSTPHTLRARLQEIAARGVSELVVTSLIGNGDQSLPTSLIESISQALNRPGTPGVTVV